MGNGAHILLISYPAQGHLNPSLQFAKRLVRLGTKVTLVTTVHAQRHFSKIIEGLTLEAFSDGRDDGFKFISAEDTERYVSDLRSKSSEKLKEVIKNSEREKRPVTCLVYAFLLTWVSDVARSLNIPLAVLWIQPATVLDIYGHYFNGYEDAIRDTVNDPSFCVNLPKLPPLASRDLPSFLLPTSAAIYGSLIPLLKEQIRELEAETRPRVLVNTFDELEPEGLEAIGRYNFMGIGPLVPSAFLDQKDRSDRSFGCDLHLLSISMDYVDWLDKKPKSSVVYVSFGSTVELPNEQMEEIAYGLLESERPFLWVIREKEKEKHTISCIEELGKKGMIVPWCSQLEVLSHLSLGCFITHCGWNSTLESLVMGVPVVAFPQWTDQGTNAKMIEDVWKTGVRVREGARNNYGKEIVDRKEVKRCIEMVMGEENLKKNAMKWKELAREAVMDGGSSHINLKTFVEEVGGAD